MNKSISLDRGLAVELYYVLQVATEGKIVCERNSPIASDLREVMGKLNKIWEIENGKYRKSKDIRRKRF